MIHDPGTRFSIPQPVFFRLFSDVTCSASAMGEEIGSLQSKADCKEENT